MTASPSRGSSGSIVGGSACRIRERVWNREGVGVGRRRRSGEARTVGRWRVRISWLWRSVLLWVRNDMLLCFAVRLDMCVGGESRRDCLTKVWNFDGWQSTFDPHLAFLLAEFPNIIIIALDYAHIPHPTERSHTARHRIHRSRISHRHPAHFQAPSVRRTRRRASFSSLQNYAQLI